MQVRTTVVIDKEWQRVFTSDDCVRTLQVAIHVAIDPITRVKSATIFTDDGRGNGTPVLTFDLD